MDRDGSTNNQTANGDASQNHVNRFMFVSLFICKVFSSVGEMMSCARLLAAEIAAGQAYPVVLSLLPEPDSQYNISYATHGYLGFEDGEPL